MASEQTQTADIYFKVVARVLSALCAIVGTISGIFVAYDGPLPLVILGSSLALVSAFLIAPFLWDLPNDE